MTENQRVMQDYDQRGLDEVPISALQVLADCRICFRERERIVPEAEVQLLSPSGIVHDYKDNATGDTSACGHDATLDGWWHRL